MPLSEPRVGRCQARDDAGLRCAKNAGHLGEHMAHGKGYDGPNGTTATVVTWR